MPDNKFEVSDGPARSAPSLRESVGDRLEPAALLRALRENIRLILIAAAAAVAVALFVTILSPMKFRARGSLYLGELQQKSSFPGEQAGGPLDFLAGRSGDVGTEIEIIRSRDLIKRAILDSGLNVELVPQGWTQPRYWRWRLARRDLGILDAGSKDLGPIKVKLSPNARTVQAFKLEFLTDHTYQIFRADAVIGKGTLGSELVLPDLQITIQASPDGKPRPGQQFTAFVTPLDQAADVVTAALNVTSAKSAASNEEIKVINLDYSNPSPHAAAAFVTSLMNAYLDRRQSWKSEEASAAEVFVTNQVQSVKTSLDAAENELAEYKRGSTVVVLGDEARQMIDQLAKYEEQRMAARLQMASFSQIDAILKKRKNAPIEQYLVGESADPVLAGLSHNLAEAQQELTRMQARFTDDAPALQEQQTQVDTQLSAVKSYVTGRRARAQSQLDSLDQMIGQFENKLKTVPHAEQRLVQLTRHTEVLSKMYSFLLERQQQVSVVKAASISKNHVLDIPEIPYREDSPTLVGRLVLSCAIGLLLGVAALLLHRLLAATYQTERDLRRDLGALPIFGSIPLRGPAGATPARGGEDVPSPNTFVADPHSPFAEAFRHLRANIYYSNPAKDDRVILITSPNPGDGKTLCTLSLAAALAADGKKVLVVEGDMHRPGHHTFFGQPREPGLSSVLTRRAEWSQALRVVTTPFGTFEAMPAGPVPPSPNELLSSPQFGALIAQAKRDHDFVLIDSPPFPLVSDALVMAMVADRVLSVVRLQNTSRSSAEEHIRRFAESVPRYGIVINGSDAIASAKGYGYGQYVSPAPSLSARTAALLRHVR